MRRTIEGFDGPVDRLGGDGFRVRKTDQFLDISILAWVRCCACPQCIQTVRFQCLHILYIRLDKVRTRIEWSMTIEG